MLHEDFSVIYSGTIVQADLLKCLLEGAGIHAVLQDEFIGMIAPYVSPGGVGAVKVLVVKSDIDKARSIVEGFSRQTAGTTKPNLRLVK
jgi:Putative prokaryotic signal transducing protein